MRRYHSNPPRRRRRRGEFPLGSVSWGTLQPEDLAEAFASSLEDVAALSPKPPRSAMESVRSARRLLEQYYEDEDSVDPEEMNLAVEELSEELNLLAPPFVYFGASEGDGSDFGFWVDEDGLSEAAHNGEVLVQDDSYRGRMDKIPKGYTGFVLKVSDHGNRSLMRYVRGRNLGIVWSQV